MAGRGMSGVRRGAWNGGAAQIYKALRGGLHPVAIREFRFDLSPEQRRSMQAIISTLTRCPDDNIAVRPQVQSAASSGAVGA